MDRKEAGKVYWMYYQHGSGAAEWVCVYVSPEKCSESGVLFSRGLLSAHHAHVRDAPEDQENVLRAMMARYLMAVENKDCFRFPLEKRRPNWQNPGQP